MGKHIKYLLNDFTNKRSEYIINWKVIDTKVDGKMKEKLVDVYKRMYGFLKLMKRLKSEASRLYVLVEWSRS